jgi:hypothetical protein
MNSVFRLAARRTCFAARIPKLKSAPASEKRYSLSRAIQKHGPGPGTTLYKWRRYAAAAPGGDDQRRLAAVGRAVAAGFGDGGDGVMPCR